MVIFVLILLARCDVNDLESYNIQRTGKRYYRSHDAFYTSCKPGFPALRSNIVLMCNNAKWTGLNPLPCTVGNENRIFSIKNLLVYLILFWLNLYKLPVTDLNGESPVPYLLESQGTMFILKFYGHFTIIVKLNCMCYNY